MNSLFIFDRSDLDEVVAIIPKGHPEAPNETRQVTRREDLARYSCPRTDVVLYNGRTGQHSLHVTYDGYTGAVWLLELLSDKQFVELEGIARRMRQNAADYEPASKLIACW